MRARACLFCRSSLAEARSREHVFPQWLLRRYDAAATQIEAAYMVIDERKTVDVRRLTFDGFLEGRVCAECNSGWMSRLESRAESVLLSLAEQSQAITRLDDDDRRAIASWAAKTAYTLNSAANFPLKVTADHLYGLARDGCPADGVSVYGAQIEGDRKLGWIQGPTWRTESEAEAVRQYDALAHESYKIALRLGDLLLLVAYWPDRRWRPILAPKVHQQIWPRGGSRVLYPAPFSVRDPQGALIMFHSYLGITANTTWRSPLQLRGAVGWPPEDLATSRESG